MFSFLQRVLSFIQIRGNLGRKRKKKATIYAHSHFYYMYFSLPMVLYSICASRCAGIFDIFEWDEKHGFLFNINIIKLIKLLSEEWLQIVHA